MIAQRGNGSLPPGVDASELCEERQRNGTSRAEKEERRVSQYMGSQYVGSQYIGLLGRRRKPRRVAMLSVHTSPLHQPGTGDAGGMNVYIVELAQRLAAINIEVEIFTRATTAALPRRSNWPPASSCATSTRAPTRASPRRTCRPSCAPSRTASCRPGPATAPATTTSCTRTTGSPATSAGSPPNAGAPPGARHAHHGQGQERRPGRRRQPRTRRPRDRRDAGRGRR